MILTNIGFDVKRMSLVIVSICAILFPTILSAQTSSRILLEGWTEYTLGTTFSIKVPPTVELRNAKDQYSQDLKRMGYKNSDMVFQQKGLAGLYNSAFDRYCRIIIHYEVGSHGDYMKVNESEVLDEEWKKTIRSMVVHSIGPYSMLIGNETYKWATINGTKCIQIDYRRTGHNFDYSIPVVCRMAIFQNDNKIVIMTLSYREKEASLWKNDFDKVYKSFRWLLK